MGDLFGDECDRKVAENTGGQKGQAGREIVGRFTIEENRTLFDRRCTVSRLFRTEQGEQRGRKGKRLCERGRVRAQTKEEGSKRLGKPGISWTPVLPSFRIGNRPTSASSGNHLLLV